MSCADLLSNASAGLRQSAAPLRNMAKDMDSVVGELSAEELGLDQGKARLPVMASSNEAIQRACSQEVRNTLNSGSDLKIYLPCYFDIMYFVLLLPVTIGWIEGRCVCLPARAHQPRKKITDHRATIAQRLL